MSAFIDRYNRTGYDATRPARWLSPIDYERAQERAAVNITDAQAA